MTTFQCPSDILVLVQGKSLDCLQIDGARDMESKNCSSSYFGETGRKFGLRIKEHTKEVDSFTAGTQTRASRARESSVTHKSAITDHAVEENHVIDWYKAKVVDRDAQQQTI